MKTSENIDALINALAKAKSEILSVPMTGRNPFFKNTANPEGSKYSTLTDLFNTVNPVLSKNGLVLTQCPSSNEGRISIKTTLFHSSGQWIQNPGTPLKPDKDTAQGIASVITYGKRQEAFAILGLSGDMDDDGNEASGIENKPPVSTAPKPPVSKPATTTPPKPIVSNPITSPSNSDTIKVPKIFNMHDATMLAWVTKKFDEKNIAEDSRSSILADLHGKDLLTELEPILTRALEGDY